MAQIHLPEGYRLRAFYDQSEIIDGTIHTVLHNLLEAGLLVTVILLFFLGDLRAALIVAVMIPLSILFGFIGMAIFGVTANLMSLGAIDFGMIVDGSVVMIENSVHHLEKSTRDSGCSNRFGRHLMKWLVRSCLVWRSSSPYTCQSSRFRAWRDVCSGPWRVTVCSALLGSLILALTAVPALSTYSLKVRETGPIGAARTWYALLDALRDGYARSLDRAMRHRAILLALALVLVAAALVSLRFIGTEFMPKLDEGSILITSRKLPGIALTESIDISKEIAGTIRSFPEVTGVVTKLGTAGRSDRGHGHLRIRFLPAARSQKRHGSAARTSRS